MGRVTPEGPAAEYLEAISVVAPPPHKRIKVTCGLISLKQKMIITLGSIIDSTALERTFMGHLTELGLNVKLLSNN